MSYLAKRIKLPGACWIGNGSAFLKLICNIYRKRKYTCSLQIWFQTFSTLTDWTLLLKTSVCRFMASNGSNEISFHVRQNGKWCVRIEKQHVRLNGILILSTACRSMSSNGSNEISFHEQTEYMLVGAVAIDVSNRRTRKRAGARNRGSCRSTKIEHGKGWSQSAWVSCARPTCRPLRRAAKKGLLLSLDRSSQDSRELAASPSAIMLMWGCGFSVCVLPRCPLYRSSMAGHGYGWLVAYEHEYMS
jgi:hypothetical protein